MTYFIFPHPVTYFNTIQANLYSLCFRISIIRTQFKAFKIRIPVGYLENLHTLLIKLSGKKTNIFLKKELPFQ